MANETFKIVNKICPPVLHDLVERRNNNYNLRYSNILQVPSVKTEHYGRRSFRYAAPVLWNSLPDEFRQAGSFSQFKTLISGWNGKICNCLGCNQT